MNGFDQTIGNLIDNAKISFIGSIDQDDFPNMKAMLPPRKREEFRTFYFSTNTSSLRVNQYQRNSKASVYFYDHLFFKGVLLCGVMEVLTDPISKEMIWLEGDTMYYPQGVSDPDYSVLKFTATHGRYYTNFHSENFIVE